MPHLSLDTWVLLVTLTLATASSVGLHLYNGRYLRRGAREQSEQTRLLQRTYRLMAQAWRPGIEARWQARIVDALLQSRFYDSREARDGLAAVCPDKLQTLLGRNYIPRVDLQAIIRGAADWDSDCLRAILDEAIDALDGSYAGRKLQQIRAELQAEHYWAAEEEDLLV